MRGDSRPTSLPLSGDNRFFLDLYARYRRDPGSVPADWRLFFEEAAADAARYVAPLLEAYRRLGHLKAGLDPLAIASRPGAPELERLRLEIKPYLGQIVSASLAGGELTTTLGALDARLEPIYAGSVGLEADHLACEDARRWLYEAFESTFVAPAEPTLCARALQSVVLADEFEGFVKAKFPAKKLYSISGAESAVVFLRELLHGAVPHVQDIVIGGMHRGRLNMLATVLQEPPAAIFARTEDAGSDDGEALATGDVPYHLGHCATVSLNGGRLRITLLPHPSHLIAVAPVALGYTRASGAGAAEGDDERVLPVMLYTDAAFAGQGLVSEVMQLGGLAGYNVGGAIHLVVNNQIGFTTTPEEGRTSRYCTDIGKAVGAPIIHVNADDPLAAARVAQLALAWRRRQHSDILVDLICYRRYGHNELDEPRFTQPHVWTAIDRHPPLRQALRPAMAEKDGAICAQADAVGAAFRRALQDGYAASASFKSNASPVQDQRWSSVDGAGESRLLERIETGIDLEELRRVARSAFRISDGIRANAKVRRFYDARRETIEQGGDINFATAEALAFATLLYAGVSVRLSGQDAVRGTFTQRHLGVHDESSGRAFFPIAAAAQAPASFEAINSPLSEYAVLGFEYGCSLADPRRLVLWEAQFGDFLNGAQIVVDQFIVSAEAKWGLKSGLVVLLPHGLEGQGPDHSSARLERLLQLCAGGNMMVANPSTPANLFHLLRRQVLAPWRKPLFVLTAKSLLRLKSCVSALEELGPGTVFRAVVDDGPRQDCGSVRRVILCSGKISHELARARAAAALDRQIALIRLELLYPFPDPALRAALAPYSRAELVWCQEEPENQGAWRHVEREMARMETWKGAPVPVRFVGRPPMPVPAAGSTERHDKEQEAVLTRALDLSATAAARRRAGEGR